MSRNKNIFYRHLRAEEPKQKIPKRKLRGNRDKTIAGVFNEEQQTMNIGIAECCKYDNFSKKIGRDISRGRAQKNASNIIFPVYDREDALQKFHQTCDAMKNNQFN